MNSIKINENISILRRKKGITQEELASVLGVTNQSVSKWESGKCCPDIELLPTLANFFEVSIDELMGYKNSIKAASSSESDDTLIMQAIEIAKKKHHIYTAILQRKLKVGHSEAQRLINTMLETGYIIKDDTKSYDCYLFVNA